MTLREEPMDSFRTKGSIFEKILPLFCETKRFHYTQPQFGMKGHDNKKLFKNLWSKALKPEGKQFDEQILNNPGKILQHGFQLGAAAPSKEPAGIMKAGRFGYTGKVNDVGKKFTVKAEYSNKTLRLRI